MRQGELFMGNIRLVILANDVDDIAYAYCRICDIRSQNMTRRQVNGWIIRHWCSS